MPIDAHDLAAHIAALCTAMRDLDHDTVERACDIATDMLCDSEATSHRDDSLIDGLRWGHRAAITCEVKRGVILRIRTPDMRAISHEYFTPKSDLALACLARLLEDEIARQVAS